MNPDSTCYLCEEMLRDKYAAYSNTEKKNCIQMTMIENLNINNTKIYVVVNILKRYMQHKWRSLKILCLFIKQTRYAFMCTNKPCPNERTFCLQERNMHLH
jgi:hypothetical protein